MPLNVTHNKDHMELVYLADKQLNETLQEVTTEGRPVLLLLSGGSDLSLLRCLDCINTEYFGSHLTVSTLDERFSRLPHENNFMQIVDSSFYQEAEDAKVRFIPTIPEEREKLTDFAQRIQREFRDWYEVNRDGRVIITQGLGEDGHTAGIAPTTEEQPFQDRFMTYEWVIGYDTQGTLQPSKRITTTITFLTEMVYTSIMYVVGSHKAMAVRDLMKEEFKRELFTLPGRVIHHMRDVHVFTDIELPEENDLYAPQS